MPLLAVFLCLSLYPYYDRVSEAVARLAGPMTGTPTSFILSPLIGVFGDKLKFVSSEIIMNTLALTFQNIQFDIVDRNCQPWLRGYQIGTALGYTQGTQAISKLFDRNSDEFTDTMTALVELDTEGGKQQVRIFSLRGCHLLAMLSRTKIAKEFRKWVLDILDNQLSSNPVQLEPKTKKALPNGLSLEQQDCIKALVRQRVAELPKDKQAKAAITCWSSIKSKYGKTYKAVEPEHFTDIVSLLGRLPLEGELLPKSEPVTNTNLTITLAPLKQGEIMKRWLITQHGNDMVQMFAVKPETEVKQRDCFIRDLKEDGYVVIKKDDFHVGNFVMEHLPAHLLPVLVEKAGRRLSAMRI